MALRVTVTLPGETDGATIGVAIADPAAAEQMARHVQARLDAAVAKRAWPEVAAVDEGGEVEGRVVRVRVRGNTPSALLARAEALEQAGARAVQLVWSGRPASAERAVFHVLEAWRGARRRCPLVSAPDDRLPPALWWMLSEG